MPTIIKGNPEVQELPAEREYSVTRGWRTVRRFRGSRQAIDDFIPVALQDGSSIRVQPGDDGVSTLEVWFDDAQDGSSVDAEAQITTTWSVNSNDLEKDLFTHAKFDALVEADQQALRDLRESKIGIADAPSTGDAAEFANLIIAGVTGYTISQIVLRRTKLISSVAAIYAVNANANKRYTRAGLIAAEGIPLAVRAEMPGAGQWLARTGQKEQLSSGKYQVTQEWWHADSWSPLIYTLVA